MPVTQISAYHRPQSLDAAWRLIRDGGNSTRLLGGGTDLVVNCPEDVHELVDLASTGLRYIKAGEDWAQPGEVRIGAMATFTDLLEHPATTEHAGGVLREMLSHVGSVLHRNGATVGGHLARGRLSDVVPVLVALDATVVIFDGEHHELSLDEYLTRERASHVVTEARLPALPAGSLAAFTRFSRAAFDHALLNACCRCDRDQGQVSTARVVVGESGVLGRRVAAAEDALVGRPLTTEAIGAAAAVARESLDTRGDWVATAGYRRHLAGVAVERCLRSIADRSGGAT